MRPEAEIKAMLEIFEEQQRTDYEHWRATNILTIKWILMEVPDGVLA